MDFPKRVLIVDPHRMVRFGLKFALQLFPDLKVVGEASNGEDALLLSQQMTPDVVLMDLAMPDGEGITTISAIHQLFPNIKVIAIIGVYSTRCIIIEALQAGAVGYLHKNLSIDELAGAIRTASA